MSIKGKLAIVGISAVLAFYAIVGGFISIQKDVLAKGDPYVQLRIFGEVLRHIVRDYVDEPDLEKVRVGALRGLSEGLDPYSAYLTPEQVKNYKPNQPEQATTGMILSKVAGYIYVVSVLKASPAEKAGLRSGDFIEYIDKLATRDISLYDAEEILASANNSDVELKVFRRGRPYKTKFKKGTVVQPAAEGQILEAGVGYLRVTSLAEGKPEEIKKQIQDLQKKGAQKLVLDLRGAANGSLENSASIANLFIKSGTLAKGIGHNGNVDKTIEADSSKVIFDGPIALVMDRSTASGGEVIAAAIAANKRGSLVGERTFGAGSVQQLFELKGGSAMLITVMKYADPSGTPFLKENGGVTPTVEVKAATLADDNLPEDSDQQGDDSQAKEDTEAQLPSENSPALTDDLQVKKAVELLKGASSTDKKVAENDSAVPNTAVNQLPARHRSLNYSPRL